MAPFKLLMHDLHSYSWVQLCKISKLCLTLHLCPNIKLNMNRIIAIQMYDSMRVRTGVMYVAKVTASKTH